MHTNTKGTIVTLTFDLSLGTCMRDIDPFFVNFALGCKYLLLGAKILCIGPRQANLVPIAYASSEGSGEPAHPRSLTRTSAARSYKQ